METTAVADSVSGQAVYDFPSDLSVMRSLQYKGFRVKYLSLNEFNENIDGWNAPGATNPYGPGIPTMFMTWKNQITVFPTPNESVVGGFTIFYARHPLQVTTVADTPEVPIQYHKAIIDYCLEQAYELDEDSEKQQLKGAAFNDKVMRLNDRNKRVDEYYPMITTLPEDDMYGYNAYQGLGY